MKNRLSLVYVAALIAVVWSSERVSNAVPAFARQHEFSCTTCHKPFPRLKDYGEEFAGNAFIIGNRGLTCQHLSTSCSTNKLN